MSEHLQQTRILELGLGEAPGSAEQEHLQACSSCRALVSQELELGALIAAAGAVRLPDRFVCRTTARFEHALAWRRFAAIFTLLTISCAPAGALVWLAAASVHRVLDWMTGLVIAASALLRASSSLAATLPLTTAVVLCSVVFSCVLCASLLSVMARRAPGVKYRAAARVL